MVPARFGRYALLFVVAVGCLLGACSTRSISNSGYDQSNASWFGGTARNPFYRGELTELDVLGIDPSEHVDDMKIANALAAHHRVAVRKGSAVLLLQSGAMLPDETMMRALSEYFDVQPFSGVPQTSGDYGRDLRLASARAGVQPAGNDYARALRLAAARAGAETVICYWGVLESAVDREGTKAVSWVPIVGTFVPDETQHMRIRLKLAVIDVRSGDWSILAPDSLSDSALSATLNRGTSDQRQVMALKDAAYKAAALQLVASYAP